MRRGSACTRKFGRTISRTAGTSKATPLRMARISKMLKPPRANSRIAAAMTENDSNAPTIQRTTRASLELVTGISRISVRAGRTQVGRVRVSSRPARSRHSASGCFSGRALSKAASFRQAASAATIFGNLSSGTFSRRALYTCGTRQISASVTCAPQA